MPIFLGVRNLKLSFIFLKFFLTEKITLARLAANILMSQIGAHASLVKFAR